VRFAPIGTTIANSGFAADTKVGGRDFYFAWGCFAEKMNSPEIRFGVGLAGAPAGNDSLSLTVVNGVYLSRAEVRPEAPGSLTQAHADASPNRSNFPLVTWSWP
jgi:hypothetical protein